MYGSGYGGKYWGSAGALTEVALFTGVLPFILSILVYVKKEKKTQQSSSGGLLFLELFSWQRDGILFYTKSFIILPFIIFLKP